MEIERKWLVDKEKIPYDLTKLDKIVIEQTYINFEPEIRVRNINNGEKYVLTIKSNLSEDGLKRDEYEIDITKEQYYNLLSKKEGITIHKVRYKVEENGKTLELDFYQNELLGFNCLEIEFETEEEARNYASPVWVEKEITSDVKYKNSYLARVCKGEELLIK